MREHYAEAEKRSGYTCIKCEVKEHGNEYMTTRNGSCTAQVYKDLFRNFTDFGCYPLLFTTDDSSVLCADCAKRIFILDKQDITMDIYYEGPPMYCDGCNKEIESAYGDPDTEEETKDDTEDAIV